MSKPLIQRLTPQQRSILRREARRYPMIGEQITTAITNNHFVNELTVGEASSIAGALGKPVGQIYEIFNND